MSILEKSEGVLGGEGCDASWLPFPERWITTDRSRMLRARAQRRRRAGVRPSDDGARGVRPRSRSSAVEQEIEASRSILELEDDFDGEESPAYERATWERATGFLRSLAQSVLEHYGVEIDRPRIKPGPDGSIDLHWREPSYEVLINIPSDPREKPSFYGDDYAGSFQKGRCELSARSAALLWLLTGFR